ncbi:MAG TPA: hypothetical protein ENF68_00720 [bacterium]|nr:hypothetical protein [bacterium]
MLFAKLLNAPPTVPFSQPRKSCALAENGRNTKRETSNKINREVNFLVALFINFIICYNLQEYKKDV